MSKKEKLIKRFESRPKDFSFNELITLLKYYDYFPNNKGKTSGSRIEFVNKHGLKSILIHKPHNRKSLLEYEINLIIDCLEKEGLLNEKKSNKV